MPLKSERKAEASRESAPTEAKLKRFYFPDVENGITVFAKDLSEANAIVAERVSKALKTEETNEK